MQDYKTRPGSKGRKPLSRGKPARTQRRKDSLPPGFKPLGPPAPPRRSRLRPLCQALWGARPRLGALAFAAVLLWLGAGLVGGGVALWKAPLEKVTLTGNTTLASEELIRAGGLVAGLSLGSVDPYRVARGIAAHPRVRRADVRRLFPGRLRIRIEERRPVVRVLTEEGRIALVDAEDVVLSLAPAEGALPENVRALPLVTGISVPAVPSTTLTDAGLARAHGVLTALAELDYAVGARMVVAGGDPFLLHLRLPEGIRLVIPYDRLEPALRTYQALTGRQPALLEGMAVVDFSALDAAGGGRLLLRREAR